MSTRYESASATDTRPAYLPPMHFFDGEAASDEDRAAVDAGYAVENLSETGALVLSHNEATVIQGTPEQLRALALRMLAVLPAAPDVVTLASDHDGAEHLQVRHIAAGQSRVTVVDRFHTDGDGTVIEGTPADLALQPAQAAALALALTARG